MKIIHKFCLALSLGLSTPLLFAQNDLPSGTVEIVKSFDARLEETDKINTRPGEFESVRKNREFTYELIPGTTKVDYKMPDIKPLAMSPEKLPTFHKGFVKAGFGYPISPYAEAAYLFTNVPNLELLAYARHHSANDAKKENQRFMDNDFSVKATYYIQQSHAAEANIRYSLDDYYFYGYNPEDTSFLKNDVRRRFNTVDGGVRFFNTNGEKRQLYYHANLQFYSHKDNLEAGETGTQIQLGVKKFLAGKHVLFANVNTDLSTYVDTTEQKLNNFSLNPGGILNTDYFSLRGAARINSFQDEFYFFPDLLAQIKLMEGALTINAGWEGNFHKNSFRNLTTYNPFLSPLPGEINNASYLDYFGGVSGISGEWRYDLRGGYKATKNMALFVSNFEIPNQFDVLYDSVKIWYVKPSLHTLLFETLTLGLEATYNHFTPATVEKAWQIPELEANLSIAYRTNNRKFQLRSDIYFMNGIPYLTENNEAARLNTLFDISVGADYQFTRNVGAFIQANNLASNRWQRWFNYPTYGINVLGGIFVKF
jgi:hypothetical protein